MDPEPFHDEVSFDGSVPKEVSDILIILSASLPRFGRKGEKVGGNRSVLMKRPDARVKKIKGS